MPSEKEKNRDGSAIDPKVLSNELALPDFGKRDEEIKGLLYQLNPDHAEGFFTSTADIAAEGQALVKVRDALIENLRREVAIQHELRELEAAKRDRILQAMRDAVEQRELQEKLASSQLTQLRLERDAVKVEAEIASYQRDSRDQAKDLLPPPPPPPSPLEQSWREKRQEKELRLQEHEIEAEYGGDKVTRANDEAMKVFQNQYMTEGEQYTRIIEILNAYDLAADVLPEEIQKLLEEEEYHDE